MARLTRVSAVLISIFALAAPAYAADTGMLYVKSNPPGATVVIAGKERGKTPVLVKGLAAGEFTVELRITGVKPVTKQVTVKANRVSTIDVIIDVPSASLTVLSDPLEATVFLDDREVGKTPLTLEHLDPGEHRLMLLKEGHPRTARSVVLQPGGERVLEVKLGAAGPDETERPTTGESVAQAAKSVPVEVQLILTMLKGAVAKGNYAETRRNLEAALRQADMADFKEELCAAIRVVRALEAREDAIRRGGEDLVGKEVVLKTKTGSRKGKVEGASLEGITMVLKIIVGGRAVGESRGVVKWSALAPEEQDRLAASWKLEGPDGAVARAILAQARKDKGAAELEARAAGDHPLAAHYMAGLRNVTGRAKALAPTLKKPKWPPDISTVRTLFQGQVRQWNPRTFEIQLFYDFEDPRQAKDWSLSDWAWEGRTRGTMEVRGGVLRMLHVHGCALLGPRLTSVSARVDFAVNQMGTDAAHLLVCADGAGNFYSVIGTNGNGHAYVEKFVAGQYRYLSGLKRSPFATTNRGTMCLSFADGRVVGRIGSLLLKARDRSHSSGRVGLRGARDVSFDNLNVTGRLDRAWLKAALGARSSSNAVVGRAADA